MGWAERPGTLHKELSLGILISAFYKDGHEGVERFVLNFTSSGQQKPASLSWSQETRGDHITFGFRMHIPETKNEIVFMGCRLPRPFAQELKVNEGNPGFTSEILQSLYVGCIDHNTC